MRKQTKIFILAVIIANALFFLLILIEHINLHDPNAMQIDFKQHSDLLFPQLSFWQNFYAILWLILIAFGYFLYWHSSESRKPNIHYSKTNVIVKQTGFEDSESEPKALYNTYSYIYWVKIAVLRLIVLMIIFVFIMLFLSSFPHSTF